MVLRLTATPPPVWSGSPKATISPGCDPRRAIHELIGASSYRRLQHMDWSLYRCGRAGHITYAPEEPHLLEHVRGQTGAAELWRCLRCGSYVTGGPHGSGPADAAPAVRRGKQIRSDLFLKLFAIERGIRFVIFGAVAYGIWRFSNSNSIAQAINNDLPIVRTFAWHLGFPLSHAQLDSIHRQPHVSSYNLPLHS